MSATPFLHFNKTAEDLDREDSLSHYRAKFYIPTHPARKETIYFCGNSLGLMPRGARAVYEEEFQDWANLAIKAHMDGKNNWYRYHEPVSRMAANIVGAKPEEVVLMNSTTANLHLMMVSFYRPDSERHKILIEDRAFPSDQYAVESQIRFHGFNPGNSLIVAKPREGEAFIRTETIEEILNEHGKSIALVMLPGVNYYTGQAFDMKKISAAAKKQGCMIGFDLAHAAGNLILNLHDWEIDFAVWCSYKYLNGGPGSAAGCFVHERHCRSFDLPRFAGWWGNDPRTRFEMSPVFVPQTGAGGWQLSNAPVFSMAACRVSLAMFQEAGLNALRKKSERLTGYLEFLLESRNQGKFKIITPKKPEERGCQLSIAALDNAKKIHQELDKRGIICDFRPPDVIRAAPAPLYNGFREVWEFSEIFHELVRA